MTPEQFARKQREFLILNEKESARLIDAEFERMKREYAEYLRKNYASGEQPATLANLRAKSFLERTLLFLDNQMTRISIPFSEIVSRAQKRMINFTGNALKRYLPEIQSSIFEPDKEAIQNLIGRTQNGTSLEKFFKKLREPISFQAKETLIEGFARGESSQAIAKRLDDVSASGRYRALVIARTETNEAFRAANRDFLYSAGIKKYIWKSIRDNRTCLICWSLHNKLFPTSKKVFSHPNCRCVLIGFRGEKLESSEKSFAKLEQGFQKDILGKQRFEMYESGKFLLNDFVGKIETEEFGEKYFIKTISDLS